MKNQKQEKVKGKYMKTERKQEKIRNYEKSLVSRREKIKGEIKQGVNKGGGIHEITEGIPGEVGNRWRQGWKPTAREKQVPDTNKKR